MISYLKGTIIAKGSDYIITGAGLSADQAGGVGYKVFVGEKRIASFIQGQTAELYCSLYLRKDETLELYGVDSLESLELFETLKAISGIGPKAALAICSLGTRARLQEAISKEDASYFKGVHGLGQKKIQKIILELTGKLKTLRRADEEEDKEAVDALVALGFKRQTAKDALSQVSKEIGSSAQRVKEALKLMRR